MFSRADAAAADVPLPAAPLLLFLFPLLLPPLLPPATARLRLSSSTASDARLDVGRDRRSTSPRCRRNSRRDDFFVLLATVRVSPDASAAARGPRREVRSAESWFGGGYHPVRACVWRRPAPASTPFHASRRACAPGPGLASACMRRTCVSVRCAKHQFVLTSVLRLSVGKVDRGAEANLVVLLSARSRFDAATLAGPGVSDLHLVTGAMSVSVGTHLVRRGANTRADARSGLGVSGRVVVVSCTFIALDGGGCCGCGCVDEGCGVGCCEESMSCPANQPANVPDRACVVGLMLVCGEAESLNEKKKLFKGRTFFVPPTKQRPFQ